MKKTFFVLVILFTFGAIQNASAQYYYYDDYSYDTPLTYEAGVSIGAMNCLTDVGGNAGTGLSKVKGVKSYRIGTTDFCTSIYGSALYKDAYGLRLEATYGTVSGADSLLKNVASSAGGRYERNLSFRTRIQELTLVAEFYPLYIFVDWSKTQYNPPKFSPYLLAGIGVYHFNPQARDSTGAWVDLHPLHTEGEGFAEYPNHKPYNLTQINFPVGFGAKYLLTSKITLRAELMWRILRTDYLDDVSTTYVDPSTFAKNLPAADAQEAQSMSSKNKNLSSNPSYNWHVGGLRGDSKNNDTYFSINIKVGYTFGREPRY